jgi:hypothetical protein
MDGIASGPRDGADGGLGESRRTRSDAICCEPMQTSAPAG